MRTSGLLSHHEVTLSRFPFRINHWSYVEALVLQHAAQVGFSDLRQRAEVSSLRMRVILISRVL